MAFNLLGGFKTQLFLSHVISFYMYVYIYMHVYFHTEVIFSFHMLELLPHVLPPSKKMLIYIENPHEK